MVGFSPDDQIEDAIVNTIKEASDSVSMMVFKLNSKAIVAVLEEAIRRNVNVRVIVDRKLLRKKSDAAILQNSNIPYKIYEGINGEILHHKVTIVDSDLVIVGTGNYVEEDFKNNQESIVIIESAPLFNYFALEFEGLWNRANRNKELIERKKILKPYTVYGKLRRNWLKMTLLLISLLANLYLIYSNNW